MKSNEEGMLTAVGTMRLRPSFRREIFALMVDDVVRFMLMFIPLTSWTLIYFLFTLTLFGVLAEMDLHLCMSASASHILKSMVSQRTSQLVVLVLCEHQDFQPREAPQHSVSFYFISSKTKPFSRFFTACNSEFIRPRCEYTNRIMFIIAVSFSISLSLPQV